MYLIIVTILLVVITLYQFMYKGMTSKGSEGMTDTDVLDESTIVATQDTVQLPNHVSGNAGKHLTFGGDLILENNNAVEFGKGDDKDTQGGKIKYGGVNLDIYGAGKTGDPYKIKLWDNVEVGGLLQTGDIQFGDSARIHNDKNANHLSIKGPGKDGERKVKIWDNVEVGKLLANNGMDVKGAFQAYNDMNVLGKMNAKGGLSVTGDLDVSGKINNPDLANRLTQMDNFLKDPKLGAGAVDPKIVQELQTYVSGMSNTVQGKLSTLRTTIENIEDHLFALSNYQAAAPDYAEIDTVARVAGDVSSMATDLNKKVSDTTSKLENSADQIQKLNSTVTQLASTKQVSPDEVNKTVNTVAQTLNEQVGTVSKSLNEQVGAVSKSLNDQVTSLNGQVGTVSKNLNEQLNTGINTASQRFANNLAALKTEMTTMVNQSLAQARNELTEANTKKMQEMLASSTNEAASVNDIAVNTKIQAVNTNIEKVAALANIALANTSTLTTRFQGIDATTLKSFTDSQTMKTLAGTTIDFAPSGKLQTILGSPLDFSQTGKLHKFLTGTELDAAGTLSNQTLKALANMSMDRLGAIANQNSMIDMNRLGIIANKNSTINLDRVGLVANTNSSMDMNRLFVLSNTSVDLNKLSAYPTIDAATGTKMSTFFGSSLEKVNNLFNANSSTRYVTNNQLQATANLVKNLTDELTPSIVTSLKNINTEWNAPLPSSNMKLKEAAIDWLNSKAGLATNSEFNTFRVNVSQYMAKNTSFNTSFSQDVYNFGNTPTTRSKLVTGLDGLYPRTTALTAVDNKVIKLKDDVETNYVKLNQWRNLELPGKLYLGTHPGNRWVLDPKADILQVKKE